MRMNPQRTDILIIVLVVVQFLLVDVCCGVEPISGFAAAFAGVVAGFLAGYQSVKCKFYECCTEQWTSANVSGLVDALNAQLYGQHLVIQTVSKHIKGHVRRNDPSKALALSFHGWTGTGKNYVSRIIADHLYREGMSSKYVHLISATKEFPHEQMVPFYKDQLRDLIEKSVASCPRSMFIFDEMDKMPPGLIDTIKPYLDFYQQLDGVDYRQAIFLFLSNTAGNDISGHVIKQWEQGEDREGIQLKDMEKTITKSALNTLSGLWHSELITKHLLTAFIPFLPLERRHVKACIKDVLIAKKYYKSAEDISEGMVSEIADELLYYPEKVGIFSATGCKRVHEKVDFVMED